MKKNGKWIFLGIIFLGIVFLIYGLTKFNEANKESENNLFIPLAEFEFKRKIENEESFILVILQTGCGACYAYKPTLNEVIEEYNLDIYTINISNLSDDGRAFLQSVAAFDSTPTTLFITDGIEETNLNRLIGAVNKSTLVNRLKSLGYIGEIHE